MKSNGKIKIFPHGEIYFQIACGSLMHDCLLVSFVEFSEENLIKL